MRALSSAAATGQSTIGQIMAGQVTIRITAGQVTIRAAGAAQQQAAEQGSGQDGGEVPHRRQLQVSQAAEDVDREHGKPRSGGHARSPRAKQGGGNERAHDDVGRAHIDDVARRRWQDRAADLVTDDALAHHRPGHVPGNEEQSHAHVPEQPVDREQPERGENQPRDRRCPWHDGGCHQRSGRVVTQVPQVGARPGDEPGPAAGPQECVDHRGQAVEAEVQPGHGVAAGQAPGRCEGHHRRLRCPGAASR